MSMRAQSFGEEAQFTPLRGGCCLLCVSGLRVCRLWTAHTAAVFKAEQTDSYRLHQGG